jgi:hypothetical protein
LFFSVTFFAPLLVFTTWLANDNDVGVAVTGRIPDPVSVVICGLLLALSVTIKLPVRVPNALGVNVTLIEQDAPAASTPGDMGQLLVEAKSPEAAIPLMVRAAVEVFFNVIERAGLVVLITCAPKPRLVGLTLCAGLSGTSRIEKLKMTQRR